MNKYKNLPGIDTLLNSEVIKSLIGKYGRDLIIYLMRKTISNYREEIKREKPLPSIEEIIKQVEFETLAMVSNSLKSVVNATGIIIHTNLGRVPFGELLINDSMKVISGYNNLEFDLKKGVRSDRNIHACKLLKFFTGAEDILIVNNNAAAILLILNVFAKNKEVIVSRGELIEIGGTFRIPDIMQASGCKMIEVGTTNKTRISDYEKSIKQNTALLFKIHTSNYKIKGFTEEAKLEELVNLGKKHKIPVVYDMGSGLLKQMKNTALENEPDVKSALLSGIDLVSFSCDKLLGGPQAGIIAGNQQMINILKKNPMMRALRVGKLSLAFLENACKYYLNEKSLEQNNLVYKIISRPKTELLENANFIKQELEKNNIHSEIVKSKGQFGGGAMPETSIDSYSIVIENTTKLEPNEISFAKKMYHELLNLKTPILGVLKKGKIQFNLLTLFDEDLKYIPKAISEVYFKS